MILWVSIYSYASSEFYAKYRGKLNNISPNISGDMSGPI